MDLHLPIEPANTFYKHFVIVELIFTPLCLIINISALVLIIKKTPQIMDGLKPHLIMLQCGFTMWDLAIHLLIRPEFLFPYVILQCGGTLSYFMDISCHIQITILQLLLAIIINGINGLVMYKQNSIVPPGRFKFSDLQIWHLKGSALAVNTLAVVLFYLSGALDTTDPMMTINSFLGGYNPGRYEMHVYSMNPLMTAWFIFVLAVLISGVVFFVLFIVNVIRHMKELESVLSEATHKAHAMFNFTMLLQMSVTLTLLIFPMTIVLISLSIENGIPPLFLHFCVSVPTFHSTVHTIMLLTLTPCYRNAIAEVFRRSSRPAV